MLVGMEEGHAVEMGVLESLCREWYQETGRVIDNGGWRDSRWNKRTVVVYLAARRREM